MPIVNPTPTSMGQNAPITPQPVPTDDTAAPNISATPTNVPTTASAPSAVVPPVRTTNPQPAPSKESFWEGASREVNPQYTTDAEGNVIRSEPARTATKKSILGSILFGALQGAARGMAAPTPEGAEGAGGAASAGMDAAMKARTEADSRARAIAQQNFENKQRATAAKLQANLILAQEAHITQAMNFEKEQEPGILRAQKLGNDAAELKLRGGQQELLDSSLTTLDNLAKLGIDPMFFTEHSPALTAQIPSLVSGNAFAIQNGQRGSANGAAIFPASTLQNAVIPAGTNLIYNTYDGGVDKDGVPIPTPHALTGDGRLTAQDYLMKVYQGRAQLYKMLQKTSADMTAEQQRAAIAESQARAKQQAAQAELEKTEAEHPEEFHPGVLPATLTGPDGKPNTTAALVDEIGTGRMPVSNLGYLLTRNPALAAAVAQRYPDFDASKITSYLKTYEDFTSGKTATALTKGGTALQHLKELLEINDQHPEAVRMHGTKPNQAYNNLLNTVVDELMNFYQVSATDDKIKNAQSTLGSLFNRDAAIRQQAKAMSDRLDEYAQQWRNAAPSAAYEAQMPRLSLQAMNALSTFVPDFGKTHPDFVPIAVTANGQVYYFTSYSAAEAFRQKAGIR